MTKVSFFTLGCRVNQAETAVLQELFFKKGFCVVDENSPADIAVINSCTVTAQGDHAGRQTMNKARRLNPDVRIALIGCQAQVQKEKAMVEPNIRWVVGSARKMSLADIILEDPDPSKKLVLAPIAPGPFVMPQASTFGRRKRANLKIQDGCDHFCAYCEVPFARGRARSRVFKDVIAAARALVQAGHQEIVLTGINLGKYEHEGKGLADVIRAVEKIKGLARVRVSSVEYAPSIEQVATLMFPPHKLCRYLHIPVQSGSDRILRRMGRHHTAAEVLALWNKFARKIPGVMLGTDIMAGFPGETDEDFEKTYDFLKDAPLSYFHVFSYSNRLRARSRLFKGGVSPGIIAERAGRLRKLSRFKYQAFLQKMVGSTARVLFEQRKGKDWAGHTDNYVTIKTFSNRDLHNKIVPVKVTGVEEGLALGVEINLESFPPAR